MTSPAASRTPRGRRGRSAAARTSARILRWVSFIVSPSGGGGPQWSPRPAGSLDRSRSADVIAQEGPQLLPEVPAVGHPFPDEPGQETLGVLAPLHDQELHGGVELLP